MPVLLGIMDSKPSGIYESFQIQIRWCGKKLINNTVFKPLRTSRGNKSINNHTMLRLSFSFHMTLEMYRTVLQFAIIETKDCMLKEVNKCNYWKSCLKQFTGKKRYKIIMSMSNKKVSTFFGYLRNKCVFERNHKNWTKVSYFKNSCMLRKVTLHWHERNSLIKTDNT